MSAPISPWIRLAFHTCQLIQRFFYDPPSPVWQILSLSCQDVFFPAADISLFALKVRPHSPTREGREKNGIYQIPSSHVPHPSILWLRANVRHPDHHILFLSNYQLSLCHASVDKSAPYSTSLNVQTRQKYNDGDDHSGPPPSLCHSHPPPCPLCLIM